MFNKNTYKITNFKPLLHKKGKRWIVLGLSALMLLSLGTGLSSFAPSVNASSTPIVRTGTPQSNSSSSNNNAPANQNINSNNTSDASNQVPANSIPKVPNSVKGIGDTVIDTINIKGMTNNNLGKVRIKGHKGDQINLNNINIPSGYLVAHNQHLNLTGGTHTLKVVPNDTNTSHATDVDNLNNLPDGMKGRYQNHIFYNITSKYFNANNIHYIYNIKHLQLHHNILKVGEADKSAVHVNGKREFTGQIVRVFKHNGLVRFEVRYNGKNYFVTGNHKFVRNAYFNANDFIKNAKGEKSKYINVKLKRNACVYKSFKYNKKTLYGYAKKGGVVKVVGISNTDNGQNKMVLRDGLVLTANKNYVSILK